MSPKVMGAVLTFVFVSIFTSIRRGIKKVAQGCCRKKMKKLMDYQATCQMLEL